jgi:hypothetical protein
MRKSYYAASRAQGKGPADRAVSTRTVMRPGLYTPLPAGRLFAPVGGCLVGELPAAIDKAGAGR